jgi:hypothetical protein
MKPGDGAGFAPGRARAVAIPSPAKASMNPTGVGRERRRDDMADK